MAKSAIFLDYNGAIDIKADYLHKIEDLRLLPEVATAIRKLNDLNLFLVEGQIPAIAILGKTISLPHGRPFFAHITIKFL